MKLPFTPAPIGPARAAQFPVGAAVTLAELHADPYPAYARLRAAEPVSWIPAAGMWMITRADLARAVLLDDAAFTVGFDGSTVYDILGLHMMTLDGPAARTEKVPFRASFTGSHVRATLAPAMVARVTQLIDGFRATGRADLRHDFAARLPILVMLDLFGLDDALEPDLRRWFKALEAGIGNIAQDSDIRARGQQAADEFRTMIIAALARPKAALLADLAQSDLTNDQIARNASLVFFGGISTVEALILNALHALATVDALLDQLGDNPALLDPLIEETVRFYGPVQSSHRHVTRSTQIGGIILPQGETVSVVQAACNRDPAVFADPDRFDLSRPATPRHIGFATGPHLCLGQHLARAQARVALEGLVGALAQLALSVDAPQGAEFRQPRTATARWAKQ
ncbi:cytochrome P450 [Octadecabacter sp. R77987]|uniref:cytochrome P450 n=1 Tax=Octadecabacter sp. R77987 TaxID=3093874 RepID=UPI0036732757